MAWWPGTKNEGMRKRLRVAVHCNGLDATQEDALTGLTLELSGRCWPPHDSTAARRSGPLERIVRRIWHGLNVDWLDPS